MMLKNHKPYIVLVFVQFIYAGNALFSKVTIAQGMNPFVFVAYRQAFASLALAPFAYFFERNKASISFKLLCTVFVVSLCGLTMSLNIYYIAIDYTSATFAAATANIIPAITFIFAVLFRLERVSIRKVHGIAKLMGAMIGIMGALVYAFLKGPMVKFVNWEWDPDKVEKMTEPPLKSTIKGPILMLTANAAWSLWLILQGPLMKEYPAKLSLTTIQCFFCCLQTAIWTIITDRGLSIWKLQWDLRLLSVAFCGIVVTALTYWLQVWTVEKKGPVFTAAFTPLALVITAIFSACLWKEPLFWGRIGGAILMVLGLYSVLWGKDKEESKSSNEYQGETKQEIVLNCVISDTPK